VLEIGSLNLGKSVRDFFKECDYIGLDVGEGEGVDIVCGGQDYDAPSGSFKHVISCEAMEHNPYWKETVKNMIRLCEPGGLVSLTCATIGRPEHGTSLHSPESSPLSTGIGWEYYKNLSVNDFRNAINIPKAFSIYKFWINWYSFDLYFLGIRSGTYLSADRLDEFERTINSIDTEINLINSSKIMKARQIAAAIGGDQIYKTARILHDKINYLLNIPG